MLAAEIDFHRYYQQAVQQNKVERITDESFRELHESGMSQVFSLRPDIVAWFSKRYPNHTFSCVVKHDYRGDHHVHLYMQKESESIRFHVIATIFQRVYIGYDGEDEPSFLPKQVKDEIVNQLFDLVMEQPSFRLLSCTGLIEKCWL